jgi:hypothetical protein
VANSPPGGTPVLLTVSVVLFFTAVFAGGLVLPLFVTRALHQQPASVGVLFSVCAAVEVVATLGLAVVPARVGQRALILGGFGSLVGYHALTVVSSGMLMLLIGQVLRGVGIAIVAGAGIRYFQDLLAPATGRATTLFANASTAGLLVSGILAGGAVEHVGYRTTLLLCGVAALVGGVAFTLGSRRQAGTRRRCIAAFERDRGIEPSRPSSGEKSRNAGSAADGRPEGPRVSPPGGLPGDAAGRRVSFRPTAGPPADRPRTTGHRVDGLGRAGFRPVWPRFKTTRRALRHGNATSDAAGHRHDRANNAADEMTCIGRVRSVG